MGAGAFVGNIFCDEKTPIVCLKHFKPLTPQEDDHPLVYHLCCVRFTSTLLNDLSDGASLLASHDQDVLQAV